MLLNQIAQILSLILFLILQISMSMAQDDCVDDSPLCGCMDIEACNYDPSALFNDDSCEYPDECGVCGGNGIPEFSEPGMVAYSFYRTHFGSGNTSQYPNYASSESDLDEMTNPFHPATSLLFEGIGEASILFDWTSFNTLNSAFGIDLPGSYVSWKFTTTFTPSETGVYFFTIEGDDGRDLTIDGDNIASSYAGEAVEGLGNTAGSIELTEGVTVTLRARGQEWLGYEAMRVFWKRPSDTNWQQDFSEIGSESFCDCDGNIPDECGVCNGPGSVYECGCSDIPDGECDCNGNVLDECGSCGGSGIPKGDCDCDGNVLDECGTCDGLGIPAGDCDCDGNVIDECGSCGGSGIPEGECDCDGNVLDECGICGGDNASCTDCAGVPNGDSIVDNCGTCDNDPSNDCTQDCAGVFGGDSVNDECGTCDNDPSNDCIQDCSGVWGGNDVLDECGICKGPGAVYACGCDPIPQEDCDCDGNILDAIGECGGACELDENDNGVCDTLEIYGCMDDSSCNYNPLANYESGDCDYTCHGCLDEDACNFDSYATIDDGLCEYESCACPADLNNDGIISVADILILLAEFGCSENCENDITSEGMGAVNIIDLLVILSVFNTEC